MCSRTWTTTESGTSVMPCASAACWATWTRMSSSVSQTNVASQPGTTSPQAKRFMGTVVLPTDEQVVGRAAKAATTGPGKYADRPAVCGPEPRDLRGQRPPARDLGGLRRDGGLTGRRAERDRGDSWGNQRRSAQSTPGCAPGHARLSSGPDHDALRHHT